MDNNIKTAIIVDTDKGNDIIAQFMGLKFEKGYQPPSSPAIWHWECDSDSPMFSVASGSTSLHFHDDWNWLMQVVEKIETMRVGGRPINVNISGSGAHIAINRSSPSGSTGEPTVIANTLNINYFAMEPQEEEKKITGVWIAIVHFIRWYMSNGEINTLNM